MSPENTQKLYETFPYLYRRQSEAAKELMRYGFECDDGWFDLIWKLSLAIEENAWRAGIKPQSDDWPEAVQVKQKVGTLRFYLAKHTEATTTLINAAVETSEKICEVCGAPGSPVAKSQRGAKTLCSGHAEEFLQNTSAANKTPV